MSHVRMIEWCRFIDLLLKVAFNYDTRFRYRVLIQKG